MNTEILSDAALVTQSLAGNQDAFGRIVTRYQTLICSIAYSGTGSLSQSEDLAQETFLAAWKQLAGLREPQKLRSWLCRIARNLTADALRQDGREPAHTAEPLEAVDQAPATGPLPHDLTIGREEEALLWHSLERIPANYREPLVLFYREHQSVEAVARSLELSEDTVKQRLSRGRKMLQEQVQAFVEGALAQTSPGQAFTVSVLSSLPALTLSGAATATGATAAKGVTAKAAGMAAVLGMLMGPLIVFVPNYFGYRVALASTRSEEERHYVKSFFGKIGAITLAVFLPAAAIILWLTRHQADRSYLSGLFATILVLIFLPTMMVVIGRTRKQTRAYQLRILAEEHGGVFPPPAWEYRSRLELLGLPLVHIRAGDRFGFLKKPVTAWIAAGQRAVGGLFAFGTVAIAPVSVGSLAIGGLSLGGLSCGIVALGGIALGGWAMFGGVLAGWQALGGCFTVAWKAAVGDFALAHDFALGLYAHAAQANNETARQFIQPSFVWRCAEFINHHWLWLNLFWMVPFFIMWRLSPQAKKTGRR
ncbi:MAG TPA: sigma-70 family RNA polymerase sigma factor [Opitutaceae bacterium]|nr:sigma-70 family RNA polymerase sigma factor [Opitutaceae bacterium]